MASTTLRRGTVVEFSAQRAWGSVQLADGDQVPFHAVAIADGSRDISVGVTVMCQVVPGRGGVWEAAGIAPIAG